MDIVAHARAVRRVIVVAEHGEERALADSDLRDIRHEIVRDAVRVFADLAAFVRADGIEVAQKHHAPVGVGHADILQDLLNDILRAAIGVGDLAGVIRLQKRRRIGHTVNGGGGAEDHALAARLCHHAAQRHRAADIVIIIFKRLLHRLADRFQTGEMNDSVDLVFRKNLAQPRLVADVALIERKIASAQLLHTLQRDRAGVIIVIQHHDVIARRQHLNAGVRADKSTASGNKYCHFHPSGV